MLLPSFLNSKLYLFFCLHFFFNFIVADNPYFKREYSLVKPYMDDRWDITGSTLISSTAIRLTSDTQSQRGAAWSKYPCTLKNWEVHLHFKIHGQGTELFGDGFAFWYTKDRMQQGPVFGSINNFIGLALFFDTYANQNGAHNHLHPYVSAMINNGSLSYDHDRDGTHTELNGCESRIRLSSHETFAAIRYLNNILTVSMDVEGKGDWNLCFSSENVFLPTNYFFGVSAATGELTDNHDIFSIRVFDISSEEEDNKDEDLSKVIPSAQFFAPPRDHVEDPKSSSLSKLTGWRFVGVVFLFLVAGITVATVSYLVYNRNQQYARQRFY